MARIKKVVPDNPSDPAELAKLPEDREYRVMHDGVGRHRAGDAVAAKQLGLGADIHRLLLAGAIVRRTAEELAADEESDILDPDEDVEQVPTARVTTGSPGGPAPRTNAPEGDRGAAPGTTDQAQVKANPDVASGPVPPAAQEALKRDVESAPAEGDKDRPAFFGGKKGGK